MIKKNNSTISDVSRLAKVSVATVSRVVSNKCYVKPETKEKVNKAIQELGYQPNQSARNLRMNTSGVILVITPNMTNPYYANIITGISETARKYECSTFVCSTDSDDKQDVAFMQLLQHRADAAIVLATNSNDVSLLPYLDWFPVVFCSEYNPDLKVDRISIDNYKAAYEATEYLIKLGHKKIGMMSSENDYVSTKLRKKGFIDACEKYQIEVDEDHIIYASKDYSFSSARRLAKDFLSRENRVTALFCISDILALGANQGAKELGLDVPKDISIMGFDNLEYAQMIIPQITTVHQPCYEIGVAAMERIHQKLMNKEEDVKVEVLEHHLVIRGSTIPLKMD